MGLTLSHTSALRLTRTLRSKGEDLRAMTHVGLARPSTWVGKRWSMREFYSDEWKWDRPSAKRPLHVLVSNGLHRIRMHNIDCHLCATSLPAHAILWIDEHTSMSGPELLFVQMAESMSDDGEGHLDLAGLVHAARLAALADDESKNQLTAELRQKTRDVRTKVIDDLRRNRQLAARGRLVMPATKEDLRDVDALDTLTREILSCASEVFGADTRAFEQTFENTELRRERSALLASLLSIDNAVSPYHEP